MGGVWGKNSKYFLNLEKRNYNIKYIKKNPNQIIDEQVNFYTDLYRSKKDTHIDKNLLDTFLTNNSNIPKYICHLTNLRVLMGSQQTFINHFGMN